MRMRPPVRLPVRAVALVLLVLVVDLVGVPVPDGTRAAAPSQSPGANVSPVASPVDPRSLVMVLTGGLKGGRPWGASGFGVFLDPSGLILAPATVVAPDASGVAVRYSDPNLPATVTEIAIGIFPGNGGPPAFPYIGKVVAVDGYLDLAIVALAEHTITGPVAPGSVTVPAIQLSSATIGAGRSVVVLENTQRNTAVTTTTTESTSDARLAPRAAELVTAMPNDGAWPGQNLILDASGALIAFPSFNPQQPPGTVRGRPYPLIQPLLAAARAGTPYVSPFVVAGTGSERLDFTSWVKEASPCGATSSPVTAYPSRPSVITALYAASGFTSQEDYLWLWYDPTDYRFVATGTGRWDGAPSRCHSLSLTAPPGGSLPDGRYGLGVFAGGNLRMVSIVETAVGDEAAAAGRLSVRGRLVDADTLEPIEGGFVFLLKPGVDVGSWFADRDDSQVASSGVTEADGDYVLQPAVARGLYGFVADAFGYQPWGGLVRLETDHLSDLGLVPLE